MDIKKQLAKVNVEVNVVDDHFIFTMPDKKQKIVNKKKLEQYLFICLLDYIDVKIDE